MSRLAEDLRQRTKRYASATIQLYVKLPRGRKEVEVLGHPLLRSSSEFCSKLDGLLQEADESGLWLELLRDDCAIEGETLKHLLRETDELPAIFTTMVAKLRKRGD